MGSKKLKFFRMETDSRGITVVTFDRPPVNAVSFDVYPDNQQPELQIISLIPITTGEAALARDEGPDALFTRFKEHRANILDVRRPAVA